MRQPRQYPGALIYRALLRLLPGKLWRGYEEDMVDFYRQRREEVEPGRGRRLLFTLGVLIDHARHGPATWRGDANGPRGSSGKGPRGGEPVIHSVLQDTQFALRTLKRRPVFAGVAILTLGLGIGVATIMFSVVDWVLLRPLPFAQPDEIVSVWQVFPGFKEIANLRDSWDRGWVSHDQFRTWREDQKAFSAVAIHDRGTQPLTGMGHAEVLQVGRGSASLMQVLGVAPSAGRWFTPEEEGTEPRSAHAVVVVSDEFWRGRMAGRDEVLGQSLTLDGRQHTIIGVLPPAFRLRVLSWGRFDLGHRDVWVPAPKDGGYHWDAIGRLAPGVTRAQAKAEIEALLLSDVDPSERWFNVIWRSRAEDVGLEAPLTLLLAGTGLLLLIACGNVATLLLGEMQSRQHEIAARSALGAGRWRIARQLLTESLVLGALGSGVGTTIAVLGTPLMVRLGPSLPWMDKITVDLRVLGAGAALTIASAIVFGIPPAYFATRRGAAGQLRAQTRGAATSAGRMSRYVVGAEVALTTVLLITCALLGRSFVELLSVDPGFVPHNLAVIALRPTLAPDDDFGEYVAFLEQAAERLRQAEGVDHVAVASGVPFWDTNSSYVVTAGAALDDEASTSALSWYVADNFRSIMEIPLLAGRDISRAEVALGARVTLVSESLASQLWPHQSPLGQTLRYTESGLLTVVGVVGDIKHQALGYQTEAAFYLPFFDGTEWSGTTNLVVRTRTAAADSLNDLKAAVWEVDPDALIAEARTLESLIADTAFSDRYRTLLTALFAASATVLATIGLFGVTARAVAHRRSEMGIRMALGARGSTLTRNVLFGSLRVALAGIASGLLLALWAGYLIRDFLFDIAPSDPLTYIAVPAGLALICVAAGYLPARRAASVDPMQTLRSE